MTALWLAECAEKNIVDVMMVTFLTGTMIVLLGNRNKKPSEQFSTRQSIFVLLIALVFFVGTLYLIYEVTK